MFLAKVLYSAMAEKKFSGGSGNQISNQQSSKANANVTMRRGYVWKADKQTLPPGTTLKYNYNLPAQTSRKLWSFTDD